jgi:hypothetical protein
MDIFHKQGNSKKNGSMKDAEEVLSQRFPIVAGRSVRVCGTISKSKPKELAKWLGHDDF